MMVENVFDILESGGAERCLLLTDKPSGLRAFLVLDDLTLGPAAGGVRTMRYPTAQAALEDAMRLARTMTIKCALAGLDAGGGKAVVLEHDLRDRPRAFAKLGEMVEDLGGVFRTAGDLGTTVADLRAMAGKTQFVHANEEDLSGSVARGVLRAIAACAACDDAPGVAGLKIAVQGCGAIGSAVTRLLASSGASLYVADIDERRASALAREVGAEVLSPDEILYASVDVLSPCAAGGVLTNDVARNIHAWAVCGAANNILAGAEVEHVLVQRGILFVPDFVASAGAVIEGIGASVMNLPDRSGLIDRIGETATAILNEAAASGRTPTAVAEALAWQRVAAARKSRII